MKSAELEAIFSHCSDLFSSEMNDESGNSYVCKIHDAFVGDSGKDHNCIGCNIADSTNLISKYLRSNHQYYDLHLDFTVYLMLLYLLVERMDRILWMLEYDETKKRTLFVTLQPIRKWANFLKHPKSFILTHHPVYDFVNSGVSHRTTFSVIIDTPFVFRYYSGMELNDELYKILKNKRDVMVMLPNLHDLTRDICQDFKTFVDLIINTPANLARLNDEATIAEYLRIEASISPSPSESLSLSSSPSLSPSTSPSAEAEE